MMDVKEKEQSTGRQVPVAVLYAIIPAILCSFSCMFLFGYNIGSLNSAGNVLKEFYNLSQLQRTNESLSSGQINLLWSLTTASFPIGGMIGSFLVSPLIAKFGQVKSLCIVQVFCIVGTLLLSISKLLLSYETVIIGVMMNGVCCGVGAGISPVYVNDITIPRLRGSMGGLFAVFLTLGITFGNVLGLDEVLNTDSRWPVLLAINVVPSLVFLLYYKWMPESPRTLYSRTRNDKSVLQLLTKLYGTSNVQSYLEEFQLEAQSQVRAMSLWAVLTKRSVRWQLLSAVVVLSSLQITGINGVMFNLNNILSLAGVEDRIVPFIAIGVSLSQTITALVTSFAAKNVKRKNVFFFGNIILSISCIIYTFALAFQNDATWLAYLAAAATLTYSIGLNSGSGVTAYTIAPEVLSQSARPAGMGVAIFGLWFSFALVSFVTPYLFSGLKFAAMLPFLAICLLIMAFVYFVVPETKNKTSSEIESHYRRRKFCCGGNSGKDADETLDGFTNNSSPGGPTISDPSA